jgi:hypothetical protein
MQPVTSSVRLAALALLLILTAGFASGQSVQVSPASASLSVGSNQTFDVTMTGVSNVQASHVQFTFDNTKFDYVSAAKGNLFTGSNDAFQTLLTSSSGTSTLTVDQAVVGGSSIGSSGTLFSVTLKAKDGASSSALGLSVSLRDPLNVSITASAAGGTASISNPMPTVTGISPTSATAGSTITTLTVTGTNFVPSSVIILGTTTLTTAYVSSTSLTASSVSAGTVAGLVPVTVRNSTPGGGTSAEVVNLTVTPGPASTATSTISATPTSIVANAISTSTITVQLKDQYGNNQTSSGGAVALASSLGTVGSVTDNTDGTYSAVLHSGTAAGTATITGTLGGSSITDDATVAFTAWTATHLVFGTQPTNVAAGTIIPVTVAIKDDEGNTVTTSSASVSLALSSQTLYGTTPVTAVNGVATFSDLQVVRVGTYTLTASSGSLTGATSNSFSISAATLNPAMTLISASPEGGLLADGSHPSTITVTARDTYANGLSGVTVAVSATGTGNTILPPSSTTDASGVTTATLASTKAESKTVSATVNGSAITNTATVVFIAGGVSASASTVVASPTTVTANGVATSTITVTVTDASGNPLQGQGVVLTATGTGNTFAQPGVTDASGVTTGTIASTVAESKTVTATAGGVALNTKPVITFSAGSAAKVVFDTQPSNAVAGATMPAVTVRIEDAHGNLVTTATDHVILTIGTNPSSGILSGTTDVAAVTGVATFGSLSINKAGSGYTLHAASGALTAANSSTFDITPGTLHHFTIGAVASQTSGTPFIIAVTAADALENTVTGFTGTVSLTTTAASITPTTSAPFSVGTLSQTVTVTGTGSTTITVSDGSGHTGISNTFVLSATPGVSLKTSASTSASSVMYANTNWNATNHEANDWAFSASSTHGAAAPVLSFYVVPDAGMVMSSFSITLSWDAGEVSYVTAVAGNAGGSSFVATPGTNSVTITNNAGTDITIAEGQYLARVDFTIPQPGYADVRMSAASFAKSGTGAFTVIPHGGEVKAYLGDVASPGPDFTSGDGLINLVDFSAWGASYWSGVPGYTGVSDYKCKYDIGPTADHYVFTLPTLDGRIDFEDLIIFSIEYGLSGTSYLPKFTAPSEFPVEISLGQPTVVGNETRIGVMVGGAVNDVRGMHLELNGQFGKFLGAEKGLLLQSYSTPVMIMARNEDTHVYVDLAVAGLDAQAVSSAGELVVLRFEGSPRMQLVKMEARNSQNMAFITTRVKGAGESVPTEYRMLQNYPNPFNPSTTIQYELPTTGEVTVEVYSMLGEKVATLVNEVMEAGYHQVQWNGRDGNQRTVASGVYFYRIHAGNYNNVMRMLMLK